MLNRFSYNASEGEIMRPHRPLYSPNPNKKCIFPFMIKEEGGSKEWNEVNKCIPRPDLGPRNVQYFEGRTYRPHICATNVDEDNKMIGWGYCSLPCSEPILEFEERPPTARMYKHTYHPYYMHYFGHHRPHHHNKNFGHTPPFRSMDESIHTHSFFWWQDWIDFIQQWGLICKVEPQAECSIYLCCYLLHIFLDS